MAKLMHFLALSALLFLAGTSVDASLRKRQPGPGLLEAATGAPQYSTLVSLIKLTDLVKPLGFLLKFKPITVFAPDNAAFAKLPPEIVKCLTTTRKGLKALKDILKYHVVKGSYPLPFNGQKLEALNDDYLYFTSNATAIYVNYVKVVAPAIYNGRDGVIHGIDNVLVPAKYAKLLPYICAPPKQHGYPKRAGAGYPKKAGGYP